MKQDVINNQLIIGGSTPPNNKETLKENNPIKVTNKPCQNV